MTVWPDMPAADSRAVRAAIKILLMVKGLFAVGCCYRSLRGMAICAKGEVIRFHFGIKI